MKQRITPPARRIGAGAVVALAVAMVLAGVAATGTASPLAPARAATAAATNPLASAPWPLYTGHAEGAYAAWRSATGDDKLQLAKIALQPRVIWFTNGSRPLGAADLVRQRIADFHNADPGGFAQLAVFGLYPRGENRRTEPFTLAMRATYRAWINNVAAGIGDSKVIMVLEPDLAVAWSGWRPNVRFALARYAASVFSRLPNTVVYLDGSDADWLPPDQAVRMLVRAGIGYVRGFALGATHYASASSNVSYGADLVARLAARGYTGKHFVIDTADNGRPLTWLQYYKAHPHGSFDNANVCTSKTEVRCLTLGIPPTTDTASLRWGMATAVRAAAASYCDAFLWYGRPWLYKQAAPFDLSRALAVARTTRWQ